MVIALIVVTTAILTLSLVCWLVIQERSAVQQKKDYPFPAKLMGVSSVITVFVILWAIGSSIYINHRMDKDIQEGINISHLGSRIAYLDTIVSHALRMAIITNDSKWQATYKDNLALLNATIQELVVATSSHAIGDTDEYAQAHHLAEKIDRGSDFFLGTIEDKTLELKNSGKFDEAQTLLDGPEYTSRKQDYSDDVEKLAESTSEILSHTLAALAKTILYAVYLGSILAITLPVTWYFSFRSVRQWHHELEKTRKKLMVNESHLQKSIGEIEISRTEAIKSKEKSEQEARKVSLLRSVSATANKASHIENTIEAVLKLICDYLDCPIGHAYVVDTQNNLLSSAELWFVKDREPYEDFIKFTDTMPIKRGAGMQGLAWEKLAPVVISNLRDDRDSSPLLLLSNLNIKSAVAVPLVVRGEVAYILEFFMTDILASDGTTVLILQEISDQLALVVERVYAQESLQKAKDLAEKASAAKSEFLANMSHELRTPLNSILGMLQLLKDRHMEREENYMLDMALRSSSHLLEIVNDILDLSKIEAGEMKLEHIGMDVRYGLKSVFLTLNHLAKEKNISLLWQDKEKFPYVLGDPTRFTRILTNLIGNAIKYTERGHVQVIARYEKISETNITFICEIIDTGIGIPAKKLQSIFQKFTQADESTTRKYGGTGLGLTITKRLVEMMGGTISVKSEVGVGSNFRFTIPFEITDTLNEAQSSRRKKLLSGVIPPDKARILMAEDNHMNQVLMTKLLTRFGISTFKIVENGIEAIRAHREAPWDIILMDCHMPEKNGYDATLAIRESEKGTNKRVPIVAMTADAMLGTREECLRCGMDEYVSKPISVDELKDVLGQWLRFPERRVEDASAHQGQTADNSVVDLSLLRANTGGDEEFQKKLIKLFVEQTDANLYVFAENSVSASVDQWKEIAHMIKGGALGIGAKKFASFCSDAQHFKGTEEERIILFENILREYAQVKQNLRKAGFLA